MFQRIRLLAAAALLLTGCSAPAPSAAPATAPSATLADAVMTPTPTPTPTRSQRSVQQVAAAVAEIRPQLMKAIDDWETRRCELADSNTSAVDGVKCFGDELLMGMNADMLSTSLSDIKPWPDELEKLASETVKYADAVKASADADDQEFISITSAMLRTKLQAWDAYL